ncbi:MAG: alanine racemase [Candidatus Omnitrophica bacterium 4484_70.2]|nr:MAG: alanine racemase [Candidatus Omnitrophica bacterium 4484_70.2]
MKRLWIEVSLKNLDKNFYLIKRIVGKKVKILGVIKQNAYGHGLVPIAQRLVQLGIDFLGVGSLEEAYELEKNKIFTPVLILTSLFPQEIKEVVNFKNIRPTIMDLESAYRLNKEAKKKKKIIPIHVKVDTGMGRLGVVYKEAKDFILKLRGYKNIFLEGIYTHFPSADTDVEFTEFQIEIFNQLIGFLKKEGIQFKYIHCANSIGIIKYPNAHFNLVRPGLILYGVNPSPNKIRIRSISPVLSLKARIIFTKNLEKDWGVSYNRTFITKRKTKIGVIACGYADGYPWSLSNKAKVIIKDRFYPLRGRVCMDYIMVEITKDISVKEEVILIGKSKSKMISCEDLADWAQTIPYEILTRLSLKIPRFYKE